MVHLIDVRNAYKLKHICIESRDIFTIFYYSMHCRYHYEKKSIRDTGCHYLIVADAYVLKRKTTRIAV